MSISERKRELRRRRKRYEKLGKLEAKLKKAKVSEKGVIADKVRRMTPGCEVILEAWGITERS